MVLVYKVVEPVILGGKLKGYLLKCPDGAEIVWETDRLKRAMKDGSVVVDGLRLTMNGALKRDKIVDYQKLVRDCNSKSSNAKSLAIDLYNRWINLGSTDKDLIGIYAAMYVVSLSVYELECLTKKRLVMTEQGYSLEDCVHDINVTLQSDADSSHCVKNANALGILDTYKNKYNISDDMWLIELERLQVLCDSTDIYVLADFVETNFL